MENIPKENLSPKTDVSFPFANLERSKDVFGPSAVFYDVPGHPELIVRKCFVSKEVMENINEELEEKDEYKDFTEEELEEIRNKKKVEQLIKNAGDFQKTGKRYGLRMAETSYVVGTDPDSGKPEIFGVTDRIIGENLKTMRGISKKMEGEIDEVFSGIIFHLRDSYLGNGVFWRDFRDDQILYGAKYRETEQHPYLIDVDPLMVSWVDPKICKTENEREDLFWTKIGLILAIEVERVEEKIQSGRLVKTREALNDVIKTVPEPKSVRAKNWYDSLVDDLRGNSINDFPNIGFRFS